MIAWRCPAARVALVAIAGTAALAVSGTPAGAQVGPPCASIALGPRLSALVSSTAPPGCPTASSIVRDFFAGRTTRHGGPSNAETYYTLNRFPGWRCGTGAGGGGCRNGARIVRWEVAPGMPAVPVVVAGRPRVRPVSWVPFRYPRLGFGIRFERLRWSGWGGPRALGRGRMRACAGGSCTTGPVQIRLGRLLADYEERRVVYACMAFVRTGLIELRNARVVISPSAADGGVRC